MSLGVIGEKNYWTRSKVSFNILKEEYLLLMVVMREILQIRHFNKISTLFQILFSYWSLQNYWVGFPVLYSKSILVIYFTYNNVTVALKKGIIQGTSLMAQWLKRHAPSVGGPGLIPGQGTRYHMQQQRSKILHTSIKTPCSQINKIK